MIYFRLFLAFSRIGLFGFGGGAAMLPVIYEAAKTLGTMDKSEFANLVGISQMTPGPIAVNAATYVGYMSAGLGGALMATFSVALPSFILVTLASYFLLKFKESSTINGDPYRRKAHDGRARPLGGDTDGAAGGSRRRPDRGTDIACNMRRGVSACRIKKDKSDNSDGRSGRYRRFVHGIDR